MSVLLGLDVSRDEKKRKRDCKSKSNARISDKVMKDAELTGDLSRSYHSDFILVGSA
jgi:hypothetical protein